MPTIVELLSQELGQKQEYIENVINLTQELGQKQEYIENVINLMDEGNTIPFIAPCISLR